MDTLYYQFVNFIQTMPFLWFVTVWSLLVASVLICLVKFIKIYNGTQKKFEKPSLLVMSILLFALVVYLTCIR